MRTTDGKICFTHQNNNLALLDTHAAISIFARTSNTFLFTVTLI